jgi:2'-5' RNA ligase
VTAQTWFPGFEPRLPTHRLFFAIRPDDARREAIHGLSLELQRSLGLVGSSVAPESFHGTLHHLGDYPGVSKDVEKTIAAARHAGSFVKTAPFEVAFDRAMSFENSGDRTFVLCGGEALSELIKFQQTIGAAMIEAGLRRWVEKQFTPHITLRYVSSIVPVRTVEAVRWTVDKLWLMLIHHGQGKHEPLECWDLRG